MAGKQNSDCGQFFIINENSKLNIFRNDNARNVLPSHCSDDKIVVDNALNPDITVSADVFLPRLDVLNVDEPSLVLNVDDTETVFSDHVLNSDKLSSPYYNVDTGNCFSVLEVDCNDCFLNADICKPSGLSNDNGNTFTNDDVSNVDSVSHIDNIFNDKVDYNDCVFSCKENTIDFTDNVVDNYFNGDPNYIPVGMSRGAPKKGSIHAGETGEALLIDGDLKILYTNADSLLNKRDELKALIDIHNPGIIGIVEVKPKNLRYEIQSARFG